MILFSQDLIQSAEDTLTPVNVMGAAGFLLGASWALFRKRPTILAWQALSSLAFAVHYVLLGSGTGAVMCGVGIAQSVTASSESPRTWHRRFYLGTVLVIAIATHETWRGVPSIAAAIGSLFATVGRLQSDAQRMRQFFLGCSLAWAVHNFMVGSVFGNACDVLTIAGIMVGLFANRRRALAPAPAACRLGFSAGR